MVKVWRHFLGRATGRFVRDRRGNVALVFALSLPIVIGGAGLGIETSLWYAARLKTQAAADVAAYSAAMERRSGSSDTVVEQVAAQVASENGYTPARGTIVVVQGSQANGGGGSVEVDLTSQVDRYFSAYFSNDPIVAKARAVATFSDASNACILALDRSAAKAANFSGSSNLQLTGCSVMTNSSASNALNVQGAALLRTDCAIAVGGVTATAGMTLTKCASATTKAPPVADPYRLVPQPVPTGSCKSAPNNNGTIQPGRYCSGMTIKGTVTLQPGVYVLEGDLSINANASLSGSGVTIFLAGASRESINGSATVPLSAPTSGNYSGILVFGDRNSTNGTNKFNGTAGSKMTGAIYFASQAVEYAGNFSGLNGCTQVIGDTVEWTGNTAMAVDCSAYGMKKIPALNAVRLST